MVKTLEEKKWYKVWEPGVPKMVEPQKSLPEYFKEAAHTMSDKVALHFYGYDITYGELEDAANRLATALTRLGMKKGDRVALCLYNCPQFVISHLAVLQAGGIVVSLNPMFKYAELEYEINDCEAETIVIQDSLFSELNRVKDEIKPKRIITTSLRDYLPQTPTLPLPHELEQPKLTFPNTLDFLELLRHSSPQPVSKVTDLKEDIALLLYTGGTTGLPKGAIFTHYALAHNAVSPIAFFGYTKDDIHIGSMPFFHAQGLVQSVGASMASGGSLVILTRFTPEVVAKAIATYKGTAWVTTTTMVIAMLEWPDINQYDLSSLRIFWYGAAPMPTEIVSRFKQLVPKAKTGEGYGLTESLSACGLITHPSHPKAGTVGIPNISTDVKIVDLETGLGEVEPNVEGEIIIKGSGIMRGYWNRPEESKDQLRDGWLYTGDIGKMDEEGYVTFLGRTKDLIKCSGFSVFPDEVEELLYRHPAVAQAAVIGVPDAYRGESTKAFIVLKPAYRGRIKEEEIIEWCKDNMGTYKRPRIVEFREELPKSAAGKVLRRILRDEERTKREKPSGA
jgi:long-chain acyl-CoA synthetase